MIKKNLLNSDQKITTLSILTELNSNCLDPLPTNYSRVCLIFEIYYLKKKIPLITINLKKIRNNNNNNNSLNKIKKKKKKRKRKVRQHMSRIVSYLSIPRRIWNRINVRKFLKKNLVKDKLEKIYAKTNKVIAK